MFDSSDNFFKCVIAFFCFYYAAYVWYEPLEGLARFNASALLTIYGINRLYSRVQPRTKQA